MASGAAVPTLDPLRQFGQQIAHFDTADGFAVDLDVMVSYLNRLCRIEVRCERARVEVCHGAPTFRTKSAFSTKARTPSFKSGPVVHADISRVLFVQH